MKIAHLIDSLETGGAETLIVTLSKEFIEKGHDVEIFTQLNDEGFPLELAKKENIPVHSFNFPRNRPQWFKEFLRNKKKIEKEFSNFDVVHSHLIHSLYMAPLLNLKQPLLYTEHQSTPLGPANKWVAKVEKALFRKYAAAVAISNDVQQILTKYFKENNIKVPVVLIENCISNTWFNKDVKYTPSTDGTIKIVSVGRLAKVKNYQELIKVVAKVPEATLDIYGSGNEHDTLQSLIEDLNATERITLKGAHKLDPQTLSAYDVFISSSEAEGFGLAIAEAMASGLPIIGKDYANVEDKGNNNLIVPDKNGFLYSTPNDLKEKITKLMHNPELLEKFSKNSKEMAEQYTPGTAADKHLELYSSLIKKNAKV